MARRGEGTMKYTVCINSYERVGIIRCISKLTGATYLLFPGLGAPYVPAPQHIPEGIQRVSVEYRIHNLKANYFVSFMFSQ